MPSSVKHVYAVAGGVALLALLGFLFAPHIFAAWVDAPASPPNYGTTGCTSPCLQADFSPVTLNGTAQTKAGSFAVGAGSTITAPQFCIGASCVTSWASTGSLSGAGTANYLSKWTSGTALGSSLIFDNGTNVGIGISTGFNALAGNKLEVAGAILGKAFFDQDNAAYFLDPASSGSGNLAGTLTTVGLKVTGGTLAAGNVLTSDISGNAIWAAPSGGSWTLSGTNIYNSNAGRVGIGRTTFDLTNNAKLIVNNPETVGKTGSAGDAIYAYANSANAAISAEQGGSGSAIYASGNVSVVGTVTATDVCTSAGKCLSQAQLAAPVITFTTTPTSGIIQNGYTETFSWSTQYATTCTGSNTAGDAFTGSQLTSGSFTTKALAGPATWSYTLSCNGAGGTTVQSTSVQVIAAGSATYANGTGGLVTLPPGVAVVKFNARGGNGGAGVARGATPNFGAGGGGGSAFANYGSGVQILSVGGGGGGAFAAAGGAGGYTGGSLYGAAGGNNLAGVAGTAGSSNLGGTGGGHGRWAGDAGATTGVGHPTCGGYDAPGGPGGANGVAGTQGDTGCNGGEPAGGYGGDGGAGAGGWGAGWGGGGGAGGGAGGGGGGASFYVTGWTPAGGGGGGGGGYLLPGMTGPDVNGDVSLNLSLIGTSQIYIGTGAGGAGAGTTGNAGGGGTITMKW